jgi:hypothetical protein
MPSLLVATLAAIPWGRVLELKKGVCTTFVILDIRIAAM